MADIKFKHYNGSLVDWNAKVASGVYSSDVVFAKAWSLDPSTGQWSDKLVIYAGKDIFGQEYCYNIPDYDTFIAIQKRVDIFNGKFTDELFKEAIENYLIDSSTIKNINSLLNTIEEKVETQDNIVIALTVGYLKPGDTIPDGTTVEELIRMIFTKILGLKSTATQPSVNISGFSALTLEAGDNFNGTITANLVDGKWNNEDNWANDYTEDKPYQNYGCLPISYKFSGMVEQEASITNTANIENYWIQPGNNSVNVRIEYTNSTNIPVKQNGENLEVDNYNDSTHYKPCLPGAVTKLSPIIKGDYYYWIGYTDIEGISTHLTRADIDDPNKFHIIKKGFIGSGVAYDTLFTTPQGNYVTIIVPNTVSLISIKDSFGNEVILNFSDTLYDGGEIGKYYYTGYKVYQELAVSEAGLVRQLIKIS